MPPKEADEVLPRYEFALVLCYRHHTTAHLISQLTLTAQFIVRLPLAIVCFDSLRDAPPLKKKPRTLTIRTKGEHSP